MEKIETGNGRFEGLLFTDKPPTFENGNLGIANFTKENFKYSERSKTKGKIYIGGILLENGELKNLKVLKGINEILDKEALRITKLMEGKWSPAEFEGEKLRKKIVIPFTIE
ncbi:energy transducer TonB [Polaribacter vadi]|uniref:energy transducer TonB n=1 Tax=Polaribacter TaxID=52959 RepID=UPI001C09282C|nr:MULTISPECIES: energy transducer TonB [Polaribacter]MBU3010780.1 energy transducer TonB [Polaribacter vadi]MDO6740591.1 energy transducer TonB [Polaribacter sp. 1_MG-2023]